MKTNVLIAGGGIIGSAVAWALAERGVRDIVVVDLDLAGLYASSELNAGGARATWWQEVNVRTCLETLDFFREHADEFSFRERGYLWLHGDERLFAHAEEKRTLQNGFGLGVEVLSADEVAERFQALAVDPERLVGATFSPRDGLVNPNAVRTWYRERAEAAGVRFLNRHYVSGVSTVRQPGSQRRIAWVEVTEIGRTDPMDQEGVLRDILTTHVVPASLGATPERMEADVVVNCLGAWSPVFSAKVGVSDVTEPTRRQIALVSVQLDDPARTAALLELGMVVDPSNLYFHPEGADILAGYSIPEEAPGFDFHYDGESYFREQVWPRLARCSPAFDRCKHLRGWSGLYAVTPDCSGIAGSVRGFTNLFEAHSFTGRGVMQSYGIAKPLAAWIDTGVCDPAIVDLSRERFSDPARWLVESLHI
ncbi:MAG: FAD-binding oxidoreductase [Myxococcota bacterium]